MEDLELKLSRARDAVKASKMELSARTEAMEVHAYPAEPLGAQTLSTPVPFPREEVGTWR